MPKKKSMKRMAQSAETGIGNEIKEAMKGNKLLIGCNSVFKGVKKGGIGSLICASNLPRSRKNDISSQASIAGIEIKDFSGDSAELGEACGKPFNILIVGIRK